MIFVGIYFWTAGIISLAVWATDDASQYGTMEIVIAGLLWPISLPMWAYQMTHKD